MEGNRVLIYESSKPYFAELIKQMLEDNSIKAFSINKRDSNYHFGSIEIYVNRDDVIRANLLINKFEE